MLRFLAAKELFWRVRRDVLEDYVIYGLVDIDEGVVCLLCFREIEV